MADEKISLDLDPRKVLDALNEMAENAKGLAKDIEDSLGKDAAKSVGKLEDAAEKGTAKIQAHFRNLGQRVKEDLKTAFDATKILTGLKFAKELGEGIKEVFDMERAFDKLNTRLQMTAKQLSDFKRELGKKVAGTGQKMEDILPGVETAASRGNIKSPEQLASIAETLGQAKAATGEATEGLSETIVEILKNQGKAINATTFKQTMDALQATRVSGAFSSATEAGGAIQKITDVIRPEELKKMGLGTRELGGMAAMASKSGAGGTDVLKHILETAQQAGGKEQLNAIFGTQLFKGGKLDTSAFSKINKQGLGQFSEQAMGSATGVGQAELSRWIDAMKSNMQDFDKVTKGSNETADQFKLATDSLASGVDRFRQKTIEAGREVGGSLSRAASELLKGNVGAAASAVGEALQGAHENKGIIAGAAAMTAGAGILLGGGIKGLMGKGGGLAAGVAKGELAKQAGIQPVYVTNAGEIGGSAADKLGKFGGFAGKAAGLAKGALGAGMAFEGGMAAGDALMSIPAVEKATGAVTDMIFKALNPDQSDEAIMAKAQRDQAHKMSEKAGISDELAMKIVQGIESANIKATVDGKFTNPSSVESRN